MAKWKLTDTDRKAFEALASKCDEKSQNAVKNVTSKSELDFEDIKTIKNSLPPNIPVFPIFSKLTVSMDAPGAEYKASEEFRAKTEKLRQKQDYMAYKRMVESVDAGQNYGRVNLMENFGAEMKTANRQAMSIINVVITVVGAFFFGFTGVTIAYPDLKIDLATRFLIGLVLATIVFFADLYFVVKSMEEDAARAEGKTNRDDAHNLSFREMTKETASPVAEPKPKKTVVAKKKSAKAKKND